MSPEVKHTPEFEVEKPSLIFLSHTDFVHRKMKWEIDEDKVYGVLDNMGPSAILFSLLGELKGEVHFTNDEEKSMAQAKQIAKRIIKEHKPPKGLFKYYADRSWWPQVVVLEATDFTTESDITFENFVFCDPERIRQMMKPLKEITYTIWPLGSWDESYIMAEHKIPCFTVGLPLFTDSDKHLGDAMHTYDNFTTRERIGKFRRCITA